MMEFVKLKQEKHLKVKLVGYIALVVIIGLLGLENVPLVKIAILFGIVIIFIAYNSIYVIHKDFQNFKEISFFGFVIIRFKMKLEFPDYISVFGGSFSNSNDWSTVSAMGKHDSTERIVVRFFTENRYFTVFSTNNYELAIEKGDQLSKLLGVELNNNLET